MSRSREVKSLTEQTRKSDELQRVLHHLLPSMLADYCQIRSFQNGVLALNASTGAAATQLRFVVQQILPRLQKISVFRGLEKITIRVQAPVTVRPTHAVRSTPPVSRHNCQLIQETADSIQDPGLADAMRRLAMTLGRNGKT